MTPARKAELRAACEAVVTPLPWRVEPMTEFTSDVLAPDEPDVPHGFSPTVYVAQDCPHDVARFIALSRTAVPELLDALEAVERERDEFACALAMMAGAAGEMPLPIMDEDEQVSLVETIHRAREIAKGRMRR